MTARVYNPFLFIIPKEMLTMFLLRIPANSTANKKMTRTLSVLKARLPPVPCKINNKVRHKTQKKIPHLLERWVIDLSAEYSAARIQVSGIQMRYQQALIIKNTHDTGVVSRFFPSLIIALRSKIPGAEKFRSKAQKAAIDKKISTLRWMRFLVYSM